ncbi:MAG: MFS transporter, partial [Acidobacteria bacterium]|nr:MFS transporter [Acidobacteriota bacterium]
LVTLTLLNLLNYVDRYIFAALIPYIKADTGYDDAQLGWVGSAFTIIYTVCSPLFGYLGDRYRRGRLVAFGIVIWSLATAAAGIATNFIQLLLSRSAVGIGEANYATIAPGLLSDFFIKARRGLVMSIFFAAIPVGTAIGYLSGGYLGAPERMGWRHTLFLVGLPGLLTAFAAWFMREPTRGAMDDEATGQTPLGWWESNKVLLANRGYVFASLGYAASTFALGALVFWAPEWLKSDKGLNAEQANSVLALCAIVGGFLGTMLGGVIGDWLGKRIKGAYFWVCAASCILAAPFAFAAVIAQDRITLTINIFISMTLVFIGNGPVNALLVNLVPAYLRTSALGLVVVIIHVLGDGISLSLVGIVSTWLKEHQAALPGFAVSIGNLSGLNPGTQTLSMALLIMPLALLVGGVLYLWGLRTKEGQQV